VLYTEEGNHILGLTILYMVGLNAQCYPAITISVYTTPRLYRQTFSGTK